MSAEGTTNWIPFPSPFVAGEYGGSPLEPPYTLHEIKMAKWSHFIRSFKDKWQLKVKDKEIREKWKREIIEQEKQGTGILDDDESPEAADARLAALTEEMVDYLLDELELHVGLENPHAIRASCFDKIYESDTLISDPLKERLSAGVSALENVPEEEKDWHPGSNHQVLDLVHPSLFPLRYGKTLVKLTDSDELVVATPPKFDRIFAPQSASKLYQWLPTDFKVSDTGSASIDGYINNLHPEVHSDLYPVIASIFESFVPLFERVLSNLQNPPLRRIRNVSPNWYPDEYDWEGEGGDNGYETYEKTRKLVLPSPGVFSMPPPSTHPTFELKGRTVQVIVKLANIILTPEQPKYEGGSWHVEGMVDESIVASGIYYWEQENIGESRLEFRGSFDDEELPYQQSDYRGVGAVFGIQNEGPCVQNFNSLETSANRCIAFPNVYQHRVAPFSLIAPTKSGHRKILCFFLVDPLTRIPSTKNVAPQQRSWMSREINHVRNSDKLPKLPREVWDAILQETGLMTRKEAEETREELMVERKFFVQENREQFFEREFSLCEH